jgi:tyrosyl-tRNA synthetase
VAPLVTSASGAKFGKTEAGAVWLDPALTSPYQLYQFWVNTDDRDAERYLKLFTLLSQDEIKTLMAAHLKDPGKRAAQKELATLVTELVHGKAALAGAVEASAALFGEIAISTQSESALAALAEHAPTTKIDVKPDTVVDALIKSGLAQSKSEARRLIKQGGVYVNNGRVTDVDQKLQPADWRGSRLLLRKGKKHYAFLQVGN